MVEWMARREAEGRKSLPPAAIRLVVHRPPTLVLHDVALRVELLLRHRRQQIAHAIRFEPECQLELIRRHGLVVVGAVEPGGAVERAARPLHELEVLVCADAGRALKQHVLEQVGEPRAAGAFVR